MARQIGERVAQRGAADRARFEAEPLLAHAEVMGLAGREDEAVASREEALRIAEAKGYASAAQRARDLAARQ